MPDPFYPPVLGVLFDYGVVLSGPPDSAAWARMCAISGLGERDFHTAYWAPRHDYDRGHHTCAAYWQTVGRHAGIVFSAQQLEELVDADNALWTQRNQPMVDWALRLQAAGTPTGVLSNLGDEMTAGVLSRQPWLAGFDHLLWSHSVRMAKPETAIYDYSVQGLGIPAPNILFIDDRADNVEAGRAVGMQAILYTNQPAFEEALRSRGLNELWLSGHLAPP